MAGLPFLDDNTSGRTSVSRPTATVKFGASAPSSGFGGLVDAVTSVLAGTPGDPWRDHLQSLRVRRVLAPEVDVLELFVAAVSTAPAVALADEGTLALTDSDGKEVAVFKGHIDGIHERAQGTRLVTVTNGGRELAQARLNRSFEQQDAGQILQALVAELGLTCSLPSGAPMLPRLVVDDALSLYTHIARLAALSGFVVCMGADDSVKVKDPTASAQPTARIAFGVDLLDFSLGSRGIHTAAVQVTGEGAAGDQGSDAWYWLRKDPTANQSKAGSGTPERSYSNAVLRSADDVATVARVKLQRAAEAATRGWLLVAGVPQVEPGDNVLLSGMPQASSNGTYRVEEIQHDYAAQLGFRSRLRVVNVSAAGAAGGLTGLLGGLL